MKKSKLKLLTKVLALLVICLVSFVGIYVQKGNRIENIIKGYDFTKDLSGYREVLLKLSDATEVLDSDGKIVGNTDQYDDDSIQSNSYKKSNTPVNKKENINKNNYEISKQIFKKRLDLMNVEDYNLSLDKTDGKMYLQIPEDDNTDRVISNITEKGNLELKDSNDGKVYITSENLKKISSMYNTTEEGTTVYLHIELNKEGTDILKNLSSNEYATKEEENTTTNETSNETLNQEENKSEESSEKEEQKKLVLSISGNDMLTTSFDDPIQDGVLDLSMGQPSKDQDTIEDSLKTTSTIVTILKSGEMPLTYTVSENQYLTTDITLDMMKNVIIVAGVVLAILLVLMIIKYKFKGLIGMICYIGFIALYLLLIRYTNVAISISGAISFGIILIINYIISMKILSISNQNDKVFKTEYKKVIAKMVPILIISIVFIFAKWIPLSSSGMLLFWGVVLIMLYNLLVTKNIVD